ncbi:MAG: hypothetical protein HOI47_04785 [Candidatus Scalindua sp.]|jgi:CheY-like chemotaxis protein|nr:hypothetical protein [Candidatus Scalindua sp.]MBT6225957.1 hypothetical protein [Candidatus Scalindua sp.]
METIMIVDNDQYSHDFYNEMLEVTDYEVLSVYDGNEALSMLDGISPVLVVIDYLVLQNMALTISRTDGMCSGYIGNIPVIIAGNFSQQVIMVQTYLANRKHKKSQARFTCDT